MKIVDRKSILEEKKNQQKPQDMAVKIIQNSMDGQGLYATLVQLNSTTLMSNSSHGMSPMGVNNSAFDRIMNSVNLTD